MGGPWGGPTIGVPGPGPRGGRVSESAICSADMVLRHQTLEHHWMRHNDEEYLGSLDTLLGLEWRLTVLLDLVMAELPGLDRDCCLIQTIKCQCQEVTYNM